MTYTEEYLPQEDQDLEGSDYPTAFGITFTPKVSGIALALGGLLGSAALASNWVLPLNESYQKLKADEQAKQEQIEQQKSGKLDERYQTLELQLKQKEALKLQVLALFANEASLDTILLDINQLFKNRNVELTSFEPEADGTKIIEDGSLGTAVDKKLKRQSYNVNITGAFEPTQSVIRDLERLQPLILIKDLKTTLEGNQKTDAFLLVDTATKTSKIIPKANQKVTTTMRLDVIMPLTPEELAKLAPPPPPPDQQGQQPPAEQK
ncbi:pilus assembly protein [Aphanothece hegewaldii CCALA 016]|uniref:Pilus assembly protein n=1 Tax=Aphanothece hegewaldii CCALA 016 TaxID=2107694 RepID=A0A2T1M3E2_9CHRO|nr:pilus assembly protein [Aphanothece hegewaldii]PSF39363.1 pilus assembly protein [Aphanothece hegewaldii CCALA 016]